jgi:hypothetical protein
MEFKYRKIGLFVIAIFFFIIPQMLHAEDPEEFSKGKDAWSGRYATPSEINAVRRSLDPESPGAVNPIVFMNEMYRRGFVLDAHGWRRVIRREDLNHLSIRHR